MALKDVMDETTSGLEADMEDTPHNHPDDHPGTGHESSATMIAPEVETPADDAAPAAVLADTTISTSSQPSDWRMVWRGQKTRLVRMAIIAVTLAALAALLPSLIASNAR